MTASAESLPVESSVLTDGSISDFATVMGLDSFGEEQLAFTRTLNTCDVQAAPGSGKTTLVGLKLCLMARGWRSDRRGICVLSHTNVAKDIIVSILSNDAYGETLLHPPHFVGTIQTFIDSFIAVPYARSSGWDARQIDDDSFAEQALRTASYNKFKTMAFALGKRADGKDIIRTASFRFINGQLDVVPEGKEFPFSSASDSYKQYASLKARLSADGFFRYSDMFAIAELAMDKYPWLKAAVARRFPFLLIDEMQDTSDLQWSALQAAFSSESCVVQRVGDVNQALYGAQTDFPLDSALELSKSFRFGPQIAEVATRLAANRPQQIHGSPNIGESGLALLIFDEDSALKVLPAFQELAEASVEQQSFERYPLTALGSRRTGSGVNGLPSGLSYYTQSPVVGMPPLQPGLRSALLRSRYSWAVRRDAVASHNAIWLSIAELLALWGVRPEARRMNGRRAREWLASEHPEAHRALRRTIQSYLADDANPGLDPIVTDLMSILQDAVGSSPTGEAKGFVEAKPAEADTPGESRAPKTAIRLDTVHSAKGETHCATLLLEGRHRSGKAFDLVEVLPIALGQRAVGASVTNRECAQLAFVAASRPRHLLAFAIHADHAVPHAEVARTAGWRIVDVRSASGDVHPVNGASSGQGHP